MNESQNFLLELAGKKIFPTELPLQHETSLELPVTILLPSGGSWPEKEATQRKAE